MNKILRLVCLALVLTGCLAQTPTPTPAPASDGADGIGDSYYPQWGNGGYDVAQYLIVLAVDPATNAITGTTTITAQATQRLGSFNLDFVGLDIDSIRVNDSDAVFSRAEQELEITPAQVIEKDAEFVVVVAYHGRPAPVASEAGLELGWYRAPDGTINVWGEPDAARGWFPANDHPRDKATYRFEITVPEPWVVAANGALKETRAVGDQTLYVWEMHQPMASYLATINIDTYNVRTASASGGIAIRNYFPKDFPPRFEPSYNLIPLMLEFFSRKFGPYPFDEYGVVVADEEGLCAEQDTALEAQTLSIHCPSEFMGSEEVIAHELAHQWFGDSVSLKNWQDIWLKEGLATYSQWLWAESKDANAMDNIMEFMKGYSIESPVGKPPSDDLYRSESYVGGALTFHALRLTVGDKTFFKILQTYQARYRYGVAGTEDFIAVAEEVSGQDLTAFFDAWLYSDTLPEMPK